MGLCFLGCEIVAHVRKYKLNYPRPQRYQKHMWIHSIINATLTLSIQGRPGEITICDINGPREISEVSEGVNVSLRVWRVCRCFSKLPFVLLLQHRTKTRHETTWHCECQTNQGLISPMEKRRQSHLLELFLKSSLNNSEKGGERIIFCYWNLSGTSCAKMK